MAKIEEICKRIEEFEHEVQEEGKEIKEDLERLAKAIGIEISVEVKIKHEASEKEKKTYEVEIGKKDKKIEEFLKIAKNYLEETESLVGFEVTESITGLPVAKFQIEKKLEILGVEIVRVLEIRVTFSLLIL